MERIGPYLHPHPGWNEKRGIRSKESLDVASVENVGKHCILELYDCDQGKLNDEAFIRTTLNTSAKLAGATLINLITHRFKPQGVTGLALLAESHISIHTWPEAGYAAIDVFTCGEHTMPDEACVLFRKEFNAHSFIIKYIQREIPTGLTNVERNPSLS